LSILELWNPAPADGGNLEFKKNAFCNASLLPKDLRYFSGQIYKLSKPPDRIIVLSPTRKRLAHLVYAKRQAYLETRFCNMVLLCHVSNIKMLLLRSREIWGLATCICQGFWYCWNWNFYDMFPACLIFQVLVVWYWRRYTGFMAEYTYTFETWCYYLAQTGTALVSFIFVLMITNAHVLLWLTSSYNPSYLKHSREYCLSEIEYFCYQFLFLKFVIIMNPRLNNNEAVQQFKICTLLLTATVYSEARQGYVAENLQ